MRAAFVYLVIPPFRELFGTARTNELRIKRKKRPLFRLIRTSFATQPGGLLCRTDLGGEQIGPLCRGLHREHGETSAFRCRARILPFQPINGVAFNLVWELHTLQCKQSGKLARFGWLLIYSFRATLGAETPINIGVFEHSGGNSHKFVIASAEGGQRPLTSEVFPCFSDFGRGVGN